MINHAMNGIDLRKVFDLNISSLLESIASFLRSEFNLQVADRVQAKA